MKVMIVEDDTLVRLGIKSAIPWTSLGLEIVCEARDGLEAVDLFVQKEPDIVLVDISLPKLNGLDFIARVKPVKPDSEYIILTCNQEFDTVLKSLRIGVHDFVMKSTMEIAELQAIIERLAAKIRANAPKPEDQSQHAEMQQLKAIRKSAFLRDWLNGIYTNDALFRRKLTELEMPDWHGRHEAWAVRLDTLSRNGVPLTPADLVKIGYAIENVALELYRARLVGFVGGVQGRLWHALLRQTDDAGPDAGLLIEAIERYLGFSVSIGVSRAFSAWEQWAENDREASELLRLAYFDTTRKRFAEERPLPQLSAGLVDWKRRMLRSLSGFELEAALGMLDELAALLAPPYPRPRLVQNMLADVQSGLLLLHEKLGLPCAAPPERASLQATTAYLRSAVTGLLEFPNQDRSAEERKKRIDAVEQYVNEHRFDEISLNGVAAHFHISPAYLSRLYKEEKGQRFSDAVLAAKIKQAEHLMRAGVSLTEISERLGYLNLSSFTRMFKKIKGVAPSEFDKQESINDKPSDATNKR